MECRHDSSKSLLDKVHRLEKRYEELIFQYLTLSSGNSCLTINPHILPVCVNQHLESLRSGRVKPFSIKEIKVLLGNDKFNDVLDIDQSVPNQCDDTYESASQAEEDIKV